MSGFWLLYVIVKINMLLKCMINSYLSSRSYETVIKQNGKYSFSSKFCCCRRSHTACFGGEDSSSSGVHKFSNVRSKHSCSILGLSKNDSPKHLTSLHRALYSCIICVQQDTNKH